MSRLSAEYPITVLIYEDGAEAARLLRALASHLSAVSLICCGFVQQDEVRADRPKCDMFLVDVASGDRLKISEDRGPMARGCRLDSAELVRALSVARQALAHGADVLFLNKYGKSESEGKGFRPLIADAIEREIPVVIAVPAKNVESWRAFAADLAMEHDVVELASRFGSDLEKLTEALGLRIG